MKLSLKRTFCYLLLGTLMSLSHAGEKSSMDQQTFTLKPIGTVEKEGSHTTLVLNKELEPALMGLENYSHVWVLWWFDKNDTPEKRSILQVHPRGNKANPMRGVFATRSPVRPNLIAQTLCKVISVEGNVVHIDKIDAFEGTPVLDLKPYIPLPQLSENTKQ
jgi:tRNA-Thr(GGU) m(6)t(6)A37 methyltransferase TsaA